MLKNHNHKWEAGSCKVSESQLGSHWSIYIVVLTGVAVCINNGFRYAGQQQPWTDRGMWNFTGLYIFRFFGKNFGKLFTTPRAHDLIPHNCVYTTCNQTHQFHIHQFGMVSRVARSSFCLGRRTILSCVSGGAGSTWKVLTSAVRVHSGLFTYLYWTVASLFTRSGKSKQGLLRWGELLRGPQTDFPLVTDTFRRPKGPWCTFEAEGSLFKSSTLRLKGRVGPRGWQKVVRRSPTFPQKQCRKGTKRLPKGQHKVTKWLLKVHLVNLLVVLWDRGQIDTWCSATATTW